MEIVGRSKHSDDGYRSRQRDSPARRCNLRSKKHTGNWLTPPPATPDRTSSAPAPVHFATAGVYRKVTSKPQDPCATEPYAFLVFSAFSSLSALTLRRLNPPRAASPSSPLSRYPLYKRRGPAQRRPITRPSAQVTRSHSTEKQRRSPS
jgi:hypothetical protein